MLFFFEVLHMFTCFQLFVIGEGRTSPAVRGDIVSTPRMRTADQSATSTPTNGLMMEVVSPL